MQMSREHILRLLDICLARAVGLVKQRKRVRSNSSGKAGERNCCSRADLLFFRTRYPGMKLLNSYKGKGPTYWRIDEGLSEEQQIKAYIILFGYRHSPFTVHLWAFVVMSTPTTTLVNQAPPLFCWSGLGVCCSTWNSQSRRMTVIESGLIPRVSYPLCFWNHLWNCTSQQAHAETIFCGVIRPSE